MSVNNIKEELRKLLQPEYDDYSYLSSDTQWLMECQHPDLPSSEYEGIKKLVEQDLKEMKDIGTINKRFVTGLIKRKITKLAKVIYVATVIRFLILSKYRTEAVRCGLLESVNDALPNTFGCGSVGSGSPRPSASGSSSSSASANKLAELATKFNSMITPLNRLEFIDDTFYHMRGLSSNELLWLPRYKRAMEIAVTLIEGENKKQFLIDCCSYLEGSYISNLQRPIQYITGSKASDATKRRVKIFETVSGILPVKRPERKIKRELEALRQQQLLEQGGQQGGEGGSGVIDSDSEQSSSDDSDETELVEQVVVPAKTNKRKRVESQTNNPSASEGSSKKKQPQSSQAQAQHQNQSQPKRSTKKHQAALLAVAEAAAAAAAADAILHSDSSTDIDVDSMPGVNDVQDFGRCHTFASTNLSQGNHNTTNSRIYLPPPSGPISSHQQQPLQFSLPPASSSFTREDSLGLNFGGQHTMDSFPLQMSLSQTSMFSFNDFAAPVAPMLPSAVPGGLGGYSTGNSLARMNTIGSQTIADLLDAAVNSQPDEYLEDLNLPSSSGQIGEQRNSSLDMARQSSLLTIGTIGSQTLNELTTAVFGRQVSEVPGWENLDSQPQDDY